MRKTQEEFLWKLSFGNYETKDYALCVTVKGSYMATCTHCTRTLPDDAVTCPFCGRKVRNHAEKTNPEQDLLYHLRNHLRKEQQGWRIGSMVLVILIVVFLATAALSFLGGELVATFIYGGIAIYFGMAILVNIVQFSRMEEYIEGIYIDCTPALERSEKNGYFVLGIFFNPYTSALFAKTKAFVLLHQQDLFRIMQEQDRRYESTFRSDRLHNNT